MDKLYPKKPPCDDSSPEELKIESPFDNSLKEIVTNLGLNKIQRHLFLCADQTKPLCCDKELSLQSWDYLKKRLKELKLDNPNSNINPYIFRTKANCLRICKGGPILLVYPDQVWYGNATPEVIEKVIQEHLLNDKIVTEYVISPM
jgi:(2Fe-2S) ferredoxin